MTGSVSLIKPPVISPSVSSIRQRLVAIEAPDDWPVELALLPPAFPFQGGVGPCDREPRAVPCGDRGRAGMLSPPRPVPLQQRSLPFSRHDPVQAKAIEDRSPPGGC